MNRRWPYLAGAAVLVGFIAVPSVWRIGEVQKGRRLISTGQSIELDPKSVALPARGLDMALSPDGAFAYAKTTRGVAKVDLGSGKVVAEGRLPGASMCGIDVTASAVLVTDAQKTLYLLDPSTLEITKKIDLGLAKVGGPCYPCGVRTVGNTAYVALNRGNAVAIVDLEKGTFQTMDAGSAPYGVQVDGDRVFVSCWGRPMVEGKSHAPSAEVEVETDERGASAGGTLVELKATGELVRSWPVGAQPTEILADGDKVYVACANGDAIFCATSDGKVKETKIEGLSGAAPSSMVRDGNRLWVALSGENRIMALDLNSGKTVGSIETGWYPVAVRKGPNGLVVADAKGDGGPVKNVRSLVGTIRQIDPALLKPLPKSKVARSHRFPVHHAIYIIKENRTYDQLFGDLPQGKGDPSLVMYGREVTPNHHKIAEEFVLLDNFADNGSVSTDGHAWAIEGQATTFYERSFGGWTRAYPFGGDEPLAVSNGGHIWDAALAAGRTFRNYGEFVYSNGAPGFAANYKAWQEGKSIPWTAAIGVERVKGFTCMEFPGWNMNIPDGYRADVFLKEFRQMEADGKMPDLMTLYLPQDHTSGDSPGAATPRAHVADNDLAVGRIVEAVSHSKFWKDTAIFILEDDPQDGLDSVDGHRSICLVASPYTRRGIVSSTFYDQTSVLRTICDILGAKPYTRFIAASTPMNDLFGKKADLTPYTALPSNILLGQLNPPKKNAAKLDFTGPDATDEELMDRVLWGMAFPNRPYPHDEKDDR
jgi:DNA-binding beta-propeller fold protein YncE